MQPVPKRPPSKPAEQFTLEDGLQILLRGIQNHSVIADEADGQEFRKELVALESRFKGKDNARKLVDSAVDILDKYGSQANEVIARQKAGLVNAAAELAAAMKALQGIRGSADRLNLVEEQINLISEEDDLESVKARLRADVAMARAEALQERQQISGLFSTIVAKLGLSSVQLAGETSLTTSGSVYTPDTLTGLPSRAYAEAELTRAHAQFPDCYLALFVVKRLALINAKFGYSRGDQVLMKVVLHLAQSLPEFKNLFRWAPCAFLTVAPPSTSYGDLRSKVQIIELTRMTPTLEWEGRSAMVPVAIDCRIISVKDFQSPSELFLRLDTLSSDV
jgi:GGDEF domain-containing protein